MDPIDTQTEEPSVETGGEREMRRFAPPRIPMPPTFPDSSSAFIRKATILGIPH